MPAMTLANAKRDAKREHHAPVTSMGFEERVIGPHTVNCHYYKVFHKEGDIEFTDHRMQIYVDGRKAAGVSF